MTKRKKQALYILGISIPSLGLSIWGFEIGSGGGAVGLITAIGITFGVTGSISGLTMLFTKNRLGWFDSEPFDFKPIFIKKEKTEMPKIKKGLRGGTQEVKGSVQVFVYHGKNKLAGPFKSHKVAIESALELVGKKTKYNKFGKK